MEIVFLVLLISLMAFALGSGFPVAFSLPGSAILTILTAAICGWVFTSDPDAYFAQGGAYEWLAAGVTNFRGVYWEAERDTLIAIPLFIFMGIMLQRSKIAEDLLMTMAQLFGPIPGGLGISVVFVGALLAATTGIVGATVVAMGLISLPAMMRNNYNIPLSTGTIAASGTLGQIIPPSIVLIILADQLSSAVDQAQTGRANLFKAATGELSMPSEFAVTSTSAGDMFMGALVPGMVLVGLYMLYILIIGLVRPSMAPSVPFEEKFDRRMVANVVMTLVPPLALIFAVLGSIIAGIATVNQAGAIGAVGATIMASYRLHAGGRWTFVPALLAVVALVAITIVTLFYDTNIRELGAGASASAIYVGLAAVALLTVSILWSLRRAYNTDNTLTLVMLETAKTTALVFVILMGAAMLTASFRAFGGEDLVKAGLTSLPGGFWTQFIIVMAVIFFLGFFIDFIEIAVVVVPIVTPILLMDPGANVTAVWLGVMIGLNIQTSFLTPPFGFALFYLRGVAPAAVSTIHIYKGVVPFILLQMLALGIVGAFPPLVNYLPTRISLTGETAPPPVNPRLQYCVQSYIADRFASRGAELRAAIERAQALPLDALPEDKAKALRGAFESAVASFDRMDEVIAAEAAVDAAAPEYRPLHSVVRGLERDARSIDVQINTVQTDVNRANSLDPGAPRIERLEKRVADLKAERDALLAQIPSEWDERHKVFAKLTNAEAKARRALRAGRRRRLQAGDRGQQHAGGDAAAGRVAGRPDGAARRRADRRPGDAGLADRGAAFGDARSRGQRRRHRRPDGCAHRAEPQPRPRSRRRGAGPFDRGADERAVVAAAGTGVGSAGAGRLSRRAPRHDRPAPAAEAAQGAGALRRFVLVRPPRRLAGILSRPAPSTIGVGWRAAGSRPPIRSVARAPSGRRARYARPGSCARIPLTPSRPISRWRERKPLRSSGCRHASESGSHLDDAQSFPLRE